MLDNFIPITDAEHIFIYRRVNIPIVCVTLPAVLQVAMATHIMDINYCYPART